ncbi:MAG: sulfate adenylyltransferase [Alphaproteobacteria bacterium]|jgi:sulfate adenylyltransferase|nr:sulfate adenylyltransferase [Alphaproteobacteria bacterium]MDP6515451.1 sulfate adenylyltransferase [Alphaproteobacteria bacterium]
MSMLVSPHGNETLKPLLAPEDERAELLARAEGLARVPMSSRETSDLLMLAMGAYTPLDGFMGAADWRGVCAEMARADGLFWPIPITLSCSEERARAIRIGQDVALADSDFGAILAILSVHEMYRIDKDIECAAVYGTRDEAHPGIAKVLAQGAVNLAGPVTALGESTYPDSYPALYLRPAETRAMFAERGWTTVAAFQTRNPMHRSHEHLAKIAVEVSDGLLIHQVLGKLKPGDIPAEVRIRAIDALVAGYFVPETVIQAGYPIEMRYAGPREALLHALIRQNFGCSHLVVGRDHAGLGDYYGPFDAHRAFDAVPPERLKTRPLKIDVTFYCDRCQAVATDRTCPHGSAHRLTISGTRLREMLLAGEPVPVEFSRPEVLAVLRDHYGRGG